MLTMPSVPRRYGERPERYASSCLANTSSRASRRLRPSLPKMLFFAVTLVLPFASTVAMSPPHVMIGTCTGPGATAPTAVVTACASGGDWMNCPCAAAAAANAASAAAPATRSSPLMASRLALDELPATDEQLPVLGGGRLDARDLERAEGIITRAILRPVRLDVPVRNAELSFALLLHSVGLVVLVDDVRRLGAAARDANCCDDKNAKFHDVPLQGNGARHSISSAARRRRLLVAPTHPVRRQVAQLLAAGIADIMEWAGHHRLGEDGRHQLFDPLACVGLRSGFVPPASARTHRIYHAHPATSLAKDVAGRKREHARTPCTA